MKDEYNIEELNPPKKPYVKKPRQQITINIDCKVIDFFKQMSARSGIPYQTLINLYLVDCAENNRMINISWT